MTAPECSGPVSFPSRPAWREPMVWLVAMIPTVAIIATFALLYVASRSNGNNDVVADPVRRTAQVQQADLAPDAHARQRGLHATMHAGADGIALVMDQGDIARDTTLMLSLRHPTRQALDRTVRLTPTPHGWHSPERLPTGHDWNVQLAPERGDWRLHGRWSAGQRVVALAPAWQ